MPADETKVATHVVLAHIKLFPAEGRIEVKAANSASGPDFFEPDDWDHFVGRTIGRVANHEHALAHLAVAQVLGKIDRDPAYTTDEQRFAAAETELAALAGKLIAYDPGADTTLTVSDLP